MKQAQKCEGCGASGKSLTTDCFVIIDVPAPVYIRTVWLNRKVK